MKDISRIAAKYDTDKISHGYIPYYEKNLPETATKILEIGVLKGESIKMWHEIYPEAHIFGLDLFEEYSQPFQEPWATFFKGNQADSKVLDKVRQFGPFDIIIDDGSHNARHQLMTFYGLVDCTKLYVVEDLHCNKEEFYRQGMNMYNTMLGQMTSIRGMDEYLFPFEHELYDDKIAFIY